MEKFSEDVGGQKRVKCIKRALETVWFLKEGVLPKGLLLMSILKELGLELFSYMRGKNIPMVPQSTL